MAEHSEKLVAKNRKAFHDYEILERFEAGIALQGSEVKSIREGRVNLKESYGRVRDGEIFLEGCHISPYSQAGVHFNHEPVRTRKLLLHRREINKLIGATVKKGYTIVPLSVYLKRGRIKIELALARGKQRHDKREATRRRTVEREIEAELKRRTR